ncbi:MAG: S4 domain-containing protein [Pseudoclavibacter sp.]|jgi:ribosome-associated heat shock protein Hsp15
MGDEAGGEVHEPRSESGSGTARVDAWLWAVRVFKTRSAATAACRAGHVRVNGKAAKPSQAVRRADEVRVRIAGFDRVLEVRGILVKRVGPQLAVRAFTDRSPARTPPPPVVERDRGAGRPTKRERREIDRLRGRGLRDAE